MSGMSRTTARPALRVALFGVLVTLLGYGLLAGWLGFHAHQYREARAQATATADGLVIEDGIGEAEDIRVRWTDGTGRVHVERFGVYDTGRYAEGKPFPVAYDPAAADPRGFPADHEETVVEEDLEVPILLAGAVAAVICALWAWRGLRFRWAARRGAARPMTATVHAGTGGAVRGMPVFWLALAEPGGAAPAHWQRVMWHPALDDVTGEMPVTVRRSRWAVAHLPDGGPRLVPLGRLRRRPPGNVLLGDWPAARVDLRDAFVLPAEVTRSPWWRSGALAAVSGAVLGIPAALALAGPSTTALIGFPLTFATLLSALWALSAPRP
ncbi:hypothetical protein [Streptomyces sp. CC219B]|uniref:hypothetical protein n=1 Tax=Streptomyces sp. CC219B TaxID=3044574 RepID=UPI0024A83880|nr:hypothetical protein [Streptomyces sp. CC219B]